MTYCPHCAAVLDPGLLMCARCGQPVAGAPPRVSLQPPENVRTAVMLLLLAWALPLLMLARILVLYGPRFSMAQSIAGAILWILFIGLLWQRQGWARFGVLLLLLYGVSGLAFNILRFGGANAGWGWAPVIMADILRIYAAYLLFRPESNAWFTRR